ncbi:helix-turn-helix domain-containing protein [Streptomyces sp. NPDC003860]
MSALVEGRDRVEVAALFKVSVRAVDNRWARWQAGGREALLSRPRGRRTGEYQVLSEAEQAAVRQAVLDHIPCDLGFSGQLWTRRLIGELIFKLYRVRFTGPGVGSPELNPDELVNSDLKRSLPHTHRARNQNELAA